MAMTLNPVVRPRACVAQADREWLDITIVNGRSTRTLRIASDEAPGWPARMTHTDRDNLLSRLELGALLPGDVVHTSLPSGGDIDWYTVTVKSVTLVHQTVTR